MGEIQETVKMMSYAWNRFAHSDGHFLSCCGAFKRRNAEEAGQMNEHLAKCNYKAPSKASGSSSMLKGGGLIELDRMTAIEAKL